jgi:hypothetical protein
MIGKILGHYQIIEKQGAGGMGEVYAADNLSLGRQVAPKFVPDAFIDDPERMARIEREDRQGKTDYLDAPARVYGVVDFAPDRKRLAVHVADVQYYIWIYDMERREGRRLPSTEHVGYPIWRPDGRQLLVVKRTQTINPTKIDILMNWPEALRRQESTK